MQDHIFRNLYGLQILGLMWNNLTHIDEKTFQHNKNLTIVVLEGNRIETLKWTFYLPKNTEVHGFTFPAVHNSTCQTKCKNAGRNSIIRSIEVFFGKSKCTECKCRCLKENCEDKCLSTPYKIIKNQFGCSTCQCFCPPISCDAQCGGEGLGIYGDRDKTGSPVCNGCRNKHNAYGKKIFVYSFISNTRKISIRTKANRLLQDRNRNTLPFDSTLTLK